MNRRIGLTILLLALAAGLVVTACTKTYDDPDQALIDLMGELEACVPEEPEDCEAAIEKVVDCVGERQSDLRAIQKQIAERVREMNPEELEEYRDGKEMEIRETMDNFIKSMGGLAEKCPRFKKSAHSLTSSWNRAKRHIDNNR